MKKSLVREVFVLRVWKNAPHGAWIIEIQNVKSGEVTHLQDLKALPDCIADQIQAHPTALTQRPEDTQEAIS